MDRVTARIAAWVRDRAAQTYELRFGSEVVDFCPVEGELTDDAAASIAETLLDAATEDCEAEGKKRRYRIIAVTDDGQQWVCPIMVVRRPERGGSDKIVEAMGRQVVELHKILARDRKDSFRQVVEYADLVTKGHKQVVERCERLESRAEEVLTTLETLRTKALERDIMREKHEKTIELQERVTDALLPLGMAMAKRFTGAPMLPNVDVDAHTVLQVAMAMQETQLDRIREALGEPLGPRFDAFISHTITTKNVDMAEFKSILSAMTHEQVMMVYGMLNHGQQAAMKELLPS